MESKKNSEPVYLCYHLFTIPNQPILYSLKIPPVRILLHCIKGKIRAEEAKKMYAYLHKHLPFGNREIVKKVITVAHSAKKKYIFTGDGRHFAGLARE